MKLKFTFSLLAFCLFTALMVHGQSLSMDELKSNFEDPGAAWRGKPFWSWNGELEKEELIRQIHVMQEMGMGGFFMHSRTGLRTEYLGEKWFELINACIDEADQLGMEAWLYDEDRWPSGLAGGLVTKYPEYRAKLMTMHVFGPGEFEPNKKYEALFSCRLEDMDCYEVERISAKEAKKRSDRQTILAFFMREREPGTFYNGYTDVDRMSREATDFFLEITHEEYKKRAGDRWASVEGIFTDEPHRQGALNTPVKLDQSLNDQINVPWTGKFATEFEERMGYDIMDRLPDLFLQPEGELTSPVKWQYTEVTQQLFLENWVQPYFNWCEENDIKFTGHFLHENNLTSQTAMQGSLMRSYEFMHYPGIDVLTEYAQLYWIAKQCQSVARQMGQPFILSELYGVTGWQFDWAGHKYVGDWQALFGVNLRCHHLSWYTMQGQAKRDYPASMLHQSSWYKDYDYVETYFSRLGYMLSQGKEVCDVLVLNPVESVWNRLRQGWANRLSPLVPDIKELEEHYSELFYSLQGAQIDFDYGDEGILDRHAQVSRLPGGDAVLAVGESSYRTIVLGKMTTIRSSTIQILKEFADAGGTIILAGDPPENVDGSPSEEASRVKELALAIPFEREEIASAVREHTSIPVEVIDAKTGEGIEDIFCQVRRDGEQTILAAMNMSKEKSYPHVLLRINASGEVCEWDCESGAILKREAESNGSFLEITSSFSGPKEHLYTISPESVPGAIDSPPLQMISEVALSGPFQYTLDEPNLCVLDMGYVQIEDQERSDLMEILKIDQHIRTHFDIPQRAGNMVQPWFKKKFQETPEVLGPVTIYFPFYVEELPKNDLEFCLETPGEFTVQVNGKQMDLEDQGWWVDKAIRRFVLPASSLKTGENVLVQEFEFRDDLDLEALYLMGEFAVSLEGNRKILTSLPEKISTGNLTSQGFPFYSGRIQYHVSLLDNYAGMGKVMLEVPQYSAACIKVNPGQPDAGFIAWQPNSLDVTSALERSNELTLEVVLTRRNAFGPLHHKPFNTTTGPGHFTTQGEHFSMNYILHPSGILETPSLKIFK